MNNEIIFRHRGQVKNVIIDGPRIIVDMSVFSLTSGDYIGALKDKNPLISGFSPAPDFIICGHSQFHRFSVFQWEKGAY